MPIPEGSRNKHRFRPTTDFDKLFGPLEQERDGPVQEVKSCALARIAGIDEDGSAFTLTFEGYEMAREVSANGHQITRKFSNGCVLIQRYPYRAFSPDGQKLK